jgi:hypothetical protein
VIGPHAQLVKAVKSFVPSLDWIYICHE